jgi:hypothetical protein
MACSGWIPRTYFLECNKMDRRWMKINLRSTSSTQEKVVYLVKYQFFLLSGSIWGSTIPPTGPTPHKSTHSNFNVWYFLHSGFYFHPFSYKFWKMWYIISFQIKISAHLCSEWVENSIFSTTIVPHESTVRSYMRGIVKETIHFQ